MLYRYRGNSRGNSKGGREVNQKAALAKSTGFANGLGCEIRKKKLNK